MEKNKLSTHELETLRLTALDLASELELDQLLEKIIQRSRELLKADAGGIYLLNEDEQKLRVEYYSGEGPSLLGSTLLVGEGLVGEVVEKGTEVRVDNYSVWEGRAPSVDSVQYRAVIGMPLITSSKKLGALFLVNYEDGKEFDDRDALVLNVLASHAAIALANAAEFQRHKVTLRQLQLIDRLNTRLRQALDIDEILQITLEEALEAVNTNEGSVMMLDEKTGELEIRAWVVGGKKANAKDHKKFAPDEGIAGYVARTGEAYNCSDTSQSNFFEPSFTKRRIQSLLSVPIILHQRVFCIVNADSENLDYFSDQDQEMLLNLAGHVAIAIESQLLRDIGLSLSTLPLEQLYARIVESATMLTGSDVGSIFLLNERTDAVKRVAFFPSSLVAPEKEVRSDGLTRRILSTGKLINLSDAQLREFAPTTVIERQAKSLLGAPLSVRFENGVKTIGALFLSTTLDKHYNKRDEELLQSLANQAAVAIERTRNFTDLQENVSFKQSLLESAFDAIVAVDEEGKVVICNPSAQEILNVSETEVLGTFAKGFFLNSKDAREVNMILEKDGRIQAFRTNVKNKQGDPIPIRLSAVRLKKGSVGFFQDRRALESAKRHRDQLKQLMEAGQAITELSDENEVRKTVVEKTIETLKADVVCLYYFDHFKEKLHSNPLCAGTLASGRNPAEILTMSTVERIVRLGATFLFDDVHKEPLLSGASIPAEITSMVASPLKVRNKMVGVIFCSYYDSHPFLDMEEKAMIDLYFNGVATAIDNARLYEEVQQRASIIQGFYKASMLLVIDSDLNHHLSTLLDQVLKVMDVESASMEIQGASESGDIFIQQGQRPETVRSDRRVKIVSGKRSVGNLYVANKRRSDFTPEDEGYLDMVAATAGIWVERSRLREQAAAVQSIDVAFVLLSVWNRMVKQKLGSLWSYIERGGNNERVREILNDLSSVLKEIAPLEPGYQSVEKNLDQKLDLSSLLTETATQVRERLEAAAVAVGGNKAEVLILNQIEPNCWVRGNKLLLDFAFKILIDNAVTAIEMKAKAPVRLRLECFAEQRFIHISLTDSGTGIGPEIKKDLFRLPITSSEVGAGYGCLTAGMIFKVHDGSIEIAGTNDDGTHLKISLPTDK